MEQLGSGQLSARVEVEGKDEVAELGRSFNHAAERIERIARHHHGEACCLARMGGGTRLEVTLDVEIELLDRVSPGIG